MYGNNYFGQPRYSQMPIANQPTMPTQPSYITPLPQPTPQVSLLGKVVDSIDVVKAMDIPLDGSVSYFPLTDGSAIVSKQLQTDGTSKTVIYKPIQEEAKETPKYVTFDDLKKEISSIDLTDIEDEIREIKKQLKGIKKAKED